MKLRAAIYARRSTEEHQAESLETQVDGALEFIAKQGWTVEPQHVVKDTGSRAEFKKRLGLGRILKLAANREIDVLVTRDETRIGGDVLRSGLFFEQLREAKCPTFFYRSGEEVRQDSPTDKLVSVVKAMMAEMERHRISDRTREHLARKARQGHVVGGRCYGYDNVRSETGGHVDHRINPEQAAIVREIFELYAAGVGLRSIAAQLIDRGVKAPRKVWAGSCIREMLRNERYRGVQTWGDVTKEYRGGTKVRLKEHEEERVRTIAEHLRIIDEPLWRLVEAQIVSTQRPGSKGGRPAQNLLSGIMRCGECGGPLKVVDGRSGKTNFRAYACSNRHNRRPILAGSGRFINGQWSGTPQLCPNSARRPVELLDQTVLEWVSRQLREQSVTAKVLADVRSSIQQQLRARAGEVAPLTKDLQRLRQSTEKLVAALEEAEDAPRAVLERITQNEARATELQAQLDALARAPKDAAGEAKRLEAAAFQKMQRLSTTLTRSVHDGRRLLRALFPAGIMVLPVEVKVEGRRDRTQFRLEGLASLGPMLVFDDDGPNFASPRGFEPLLAA